MRPCTKFQLNMLKGTGKNIWKTTGGTDRQSKPPVPSGETVGGVLRGPCLYCTCSSIQSESTSWFTSRKFFTIFTSKLHNKPQIFHPNFLALQCCNNTADGAHWCWHCLYVYNTDHMIRGFRDVWNMVKCTFPSTSLSLSLSPRIHLWTRDFNEIRERGVYLNHTDQASSSITDQDCNESWIPRDVLSDVVRVEIQ